MLRCTPSTFIYRTISRIQIARQHNSRRLTQRLLTFALMFSLLVNSTPAAASTVVQVATETKVSLIFWFRASGWRDLLQTVGRGGDKVQEKQSDRSARVKAIRIHPGDVTIKVEERIAFAAVAYDQDDNAVGGVPMKWSARDEGRNHGVRLSQRGEFQSIAPGIFKVTVEGAGKRAHVKVTVVDGPRRRPTELPINSVPVSTRDLSDEPTTAVTSKKGKRHSAHASSKKRAPGSFSLSPTAVPAPLPLPIDGWGGENYWSADDPGNGRGHTPGQPMDDGAGSGNFQFAAPILSLQGRGVDLSLGLSYNSRVWNKSGTAINFDIDRDWPAPGWSLGFGKVVNVGTGGSMIIEANGTRHGFTGTVTNYSYGQHFAGHTTDGSLIDYATWKNSSGVMTWAEVNLPNGTQIHYYCQGPGGVFPTQIIDADGNYITITYVNNAGPRIQTVTDTMGRLVNFHYDANNLLTAVTAPGLGSGTRTLVRLHYKQLALGYSFSGLTPVVRDSYPWVIDAIYYPATNVGFWFGESDSYSSYGMLARVSDRRNMGFSAGSLTEQGTITSAGVITKEEIYNYPLTTGSSGGSGLTDAPTYTSKTESWTRDGTNFDSAVTTYEVHQNASPRTVKITFPNGGTSKQYSYNSPGSYLDGVVYLDETRNAAGTLIQSSSSTWALGAYDSARPTRTEATNERNQTTATEFSYGSVYNQVSEVRSYDYGGTTLLRAARSQYQNSTNYTGRHIFNLPLVVEVFAADNTTRVSRTEYQYDGQTLTDAPNVGMHADNHNPYAPQYMVEECGEYDPYYGGCIWWNQYWVSDYNPVTDYRGNITQITTYANAASATTPIVETRRYDINGNLVTSSTSCCEQTSITYTDATQYAYPVSTQRGSATDALAQVSTSTTYDFNTGLALTATDENGRQSQNTYDAASLRPLTNSLPTGSHTDYAYDDSAMTVTATTYLAAHPTHSTIAEQTITVHNGRGQVRQERALGANGIFDYVDTTFTNMGQVAQQSRPYRIGDSVQWSTSAYDAAGRGTRTTGADGSVSETYYNEKDFDPNDSYVPVRPDVVSQTAPGETILIRDAWGRERWGRTDSQGRLVEVVEPNPSGTGSVATNGLLTAYGYDTSGNLTSITQGAQTRSFKYDSLGRVTHQKLAEASARLNDAGQYTTSGTWSDVFAYDARSNLTSRTDARGVKTVYNFGNDPLNRVQSVSWDTSNFGDSDNPILAAAAVTYQYRTKSSGSQLIDITQVSSVTTSGISTESYGYDSEGRVSSKTLTLSSRSAYPLVNDYSYDGLSRLVEMRYPAEYGNGSQPRKLVHHDFDVASRISNLSVDGASHASQATYNAASQTTQLKVGASGANQITENYGFHAQTGLLESQTIVRGTSTTLLNLGYEYTNSAGKRTGQLTKILNNLDHNKDKGYEYDALSRLKRATGGQNVNWAQRYETDRYGNRSNVHSQTADQYVRNFYQSAYNRQPTTNELQSAVASLQSAYAQGTSQFLTAVQNLGNSLFSSQEYVNRNRNNSQYVYDLYKAYLVRDPDQGGWDFWTGQVPVNGRDAVRNAFNYSEEFSIKVNGTSPYSYPGGAVVPRDGLQGLWFDAATNRVGNTGWTYDAAGNQTRTLKNGVAQRFQYDAANRLVRVKTDGGSVISAHTYGDTNQRLLTEEAGVRTYFAEDSESVLAEYVETGSSTIPVWSKSYVYLGARLLSTLTPNGGGGEAVQYHHPDRLGTRFLTNAQNTSASEQVTLPFGTALDAESTGTTNRRFTSYDRSVTTGLDYAVNRHYDWEQGRFTQVDPIGMSASSPADPQTLNLYAYCGNDPINAVDPDGLFFGKLFKWIGKALKILSIVSLVVMTLIVFAPASSFAFKAALWMFFNVLLPLSQVPILGSFVSLGALGTPQWNPQGRSPFGNSWQGQSSCPPDCQDQITLPTESAGNIYANYSAWERIKWAANIGADKALTSVVGFSGFITLGGSKKLSRGFAKVLGGEAAGRSWDQDNTVREGSWFHTGGAAAGVAWDIATGGAIAKAGLKSTGWAGRIALDAAHHRFPGYLGKWSHLQLNLYKVGVKGSHVVRRIRLPFRRFPKKNIEFKF